MIKSIRINAGERIKIFSSRFGSVPVEYEFQARTTGSDRLTGEVEVSAFTLFFRKPLLKFPLREKNLIKAGMWDTFVYIYVKANTDMEVTIPRRNLRAARWVFLLAVLIALAALVIALAVSTP